MRDSNEPEQEGRPAWNWFVYAGGSIALAILFFFVLQEKDDGSGRGGRGIIGVLYKVGGKWAVGGVLLVLGIVFAVLGFTALANQPRGGGTKKKKRRRKEEDDEGDRDERPRARRRPPPKEDDEDRPPRPRPRRPSPVDDEDEAPPPRRRPPPPRDEGRPIRRRPSEN